MDPYLEDGGYGLMKEEVKGIYHGREKRLNNAVCYFMNLHRGQTRKCNGGPYDAHLFAVLAMVRENGGDDDTCIAAMGHDAIEDQGGLKIAAEIEIRYGTRVKNLILECTDSLEEDPTKKLPWKQRKEAYIASIPKKSNEALLILLADKIHNLECTVVDMEIEGVYILDKFRGKGEGTYWYYKSIYLELSHLRSQYTNRVNIKLFDRYEQVFFKFRQLYQDMKEGFC